MNRGLKLFPGQISDRLDIWKGTWIQTITLGHYKYKINGKQLMEIRTDSMRSLLSICLIGFFVLPVFSQQENVDSIRWFNSVRALTRYQTFSLPKEKFTPARRDSIRRLKEQYANRKRKYYSIVSRRLYMHQYLKVYQKELIPALWNDYLLKNGLLYRAPYLLAHLDLPVEMKKALLKEPITSKVPLEVRAKLGDKKAEEEVIAKFEYLAYELTGQEAQFKRRNNSIRSPMYQLGELTKQLIYIGSNRTMEVFFNALESNKTYRTDFIADVDYDYDKVLDCSNCRDPKVKAINDEMMFYEWTLISVLYNAISKIYPNDRLNRYRRLVDSKFTPYMIITNKGIYDVLEQFIFRKFQTEIKIKMDLLYQGDGRLMLFELEEY